MHLMDIIYGHLHPQNIPSCHTPCFEQFANSFKAVPSIMWLYFFLHI